MEKNRFILLLFFLSAFVFLAPIAGVRPPVTGQEVEEELQPVHPYTLPEGEEINRLLAVVEDRAITLQEYRKFFGESELSRDNLRKIIDEKLIEKALDEFIEARESEQITSMVRRQLEAMKQQEGPQQFQQFLQERELSEEEFVEQMVTQEKEMILLQRLFPDALQGIPDITAMIRGRLMHLEDSERAREIQSKLADTPTIDHWNKLYGQHSKPLPALDLGKNGDLGWFHWGSHGPEIEYRFFQLSNYEVSEPFQVGGFHLIAFKTGTRAGFPDARPSPGMGAAYEEYTRRFLENYREKLPEILRDEFAVRFPPSVVQELNDAT